MIPLLAAPAARRLASATRTFSSASLVAAAHSAAARSARARYLALPSLDFSLATAVAASASSARRSAAATRDRSASATSNASPRTFDACAGAGEARVGVAPPLVDDCAGVSASSAVGRLLLSPGVVITLAVAAAMTTGSPAEFVDLEHAVSIPADDDAGAPAAGPGSATAAAMTRSCSAAATSSASASLCSDSRRLVRSAAAAASAAAPRVSETSNAKTFAARSTHAASAADIPAATWRTSSSTCPLRRLVSRSNAPAASSAAANAASADVRRPRSFSNATCSSAISTAAM
mmetsp:Transcript_12190/g.29535  ORF Transcript_12190/g.29535 Transcript_12190/m.29535 type:complete len:291 (-) Transcript_12190:77-949(-)